jgi:hypothetical protein
MGLGILAALMLSVQTGHAADESAGVVKNVSGSARIERGGAVLPVLVGTSVQARDRIVTGGDGSVGITLKDDTRLSAGPNSVLALDQFAFNSTTNEGLISLQVLKGTLRSITGLIARQSPTALAVRTPTATIGIRGTDFIVEVPAND